MKHFAIFLAFCCALAGCLETCAKPADPSEPQNEREKDYAAAIDVCAYETGSYAEGRACIAAVNRAFRIVVTEAGR